MKFRLAVYGYTRVDWRVESRRILQITYQKGTDWLATNYMFLTYFIEDSAYYSVSARNAVHHSRVLSKGKEWEELTRPLWYRKINPLEKYWIL